MLRSASPHLSRSRYADDKPPEGDKREEDVPLKCHIFDQYFIKHILKTVFRSRRRFLAMRADRELSGESIWSKSDNFEAVSCPRRRPKKGVLRKYVLVRRTPRGRFFAKPEKITGEELQRIHAHGAMRLLALLSFASTAAR